MSSDTLAKPAAAAEEAAPPRIVPRRRPAQWAAALVVLVLLGFALDSVVRNEAFQWDVVGAYFTSTAVLRGLWLTLWLTAVVMALGFALGTLLAAARLSANPVLKLVSWGYVWLFRSVPILVQLLFWFNIGALYPHILGVKTVNLLGPVTVAVVGLTLHEAAYAAEVVRGGILSVDRGGPEDLKIMPGVTVVLGDTAVLTLGQIWGVDLSAGPVPREGAVHPADRHRGERTAGLHRHARGRRRGDERVRPIGRRRQVHPRTPSHPGRTRRVRGPGGAVAAGARRVSHGIHGNHVELTPRVARPGMEGLIT